MEESGKGDKHISRKLKGKVLSSCVTPAYIAIGLRFIGIMTMTEKNNKKEWRVEREKEDQYTDGTTPRLPLAGVENESE